MGTQFTSESGLTTIKGKPLKTTFLGFCLIMLREAIEPIILALGVSLLYSRIQSIWEITQSESRSWMSVAISDSEEHPMIYFLIAIVFVAWIFYRAWKVSGEQKQSRELKDALTGLRETMDGLRSDIKESRENDTTKRD